jgi:hypothetical protein
MTTIDQADQFSVEFSHVVRNENLFLDDYWVKITSDDDPQKTYFADFQLNEEEFGFFWFDGEGDKIEHIYNSLGLTHCECEFQCESKSECAFKDYLKPVAAELLARARDVVTEESGLFEFTDEAKASIVAADKGIPEYDFVHGAAENAFAYVVTNPDRFIAYHYDKVPVSKEISVDEYNEAVDIWNKNRAEDDCINAKWAVYEYVSKLLRIENYW